MVLRHVFCYFMSVVTFRPLEMCSTEEDDVILRRSRGGELLESEVEAESVVESVVRGEKDESGSGGVEERGVASGAAVSNLPGFGEKNSSDSMDDEDIGS